MPASARWIRYLPGAALGLYLARTMGEALGVPGVWAAILLSAIMAAGGAWLFARRPLSQTWPALLLLAYVVQPEINSARGWAAAVALVAVGLGWATSRPRGETTRRLYIPSVPHWLIGTALFLALLALYATTLAPGVLPADSGELQVVAAAPGCMSG